MLNVQLKDKILVCNTIIRQRTRVTDIVQYAASEKRKRAGHIAQMKGNGWTTRSTGWQIKGVRSIERPKRWTGEIVGQQGAI